MKGTIVVTGGTGYIGSHTAVELLQEGYDVIIIDNLSNSEQSIVSRIEQICGKKVSFHQFDIADKQALSTCLSGYKNVDAIIHFAASKAVGESVEKPLLYYRNNIVTLLNLLDTMLHNNIPNIVFSSSCTVYGQPETLPVTESSPILKATSPYGNTKQICEEIITDTLASNASLQAILLRYFNPVGAHKSSLIGELPRGVPNNLVPFITQTAIGKRQSLKVFGSDYNTPDGSCIRDYIDVVDLAKAHVVAVNRLMNKKSLSNIEIFNLGTGKGVSVLEMIKAFEQATGQALPYEIVGRRAGDIEKVWADTSKANTILGWTAQVPLNETLLNAWNWELALQKENQ